MRVLKWIVGRCHGRAEATKTALGWIPDSNGFDLEGMEDFDPTRFERPENQHRGVAARVHNAELLISRL
jgi:GTP-dependent phosphoenolpyruvate carboxykinase